MPSELDDLVLSQGPANKPRGLTFDDVPMLWNAPSEILLRHGFSPLVERLASVEPTAAAMRRYDSTWHDDLAALLTSDPRFASTRVKPGSIPRSSALGPWNIFTGPDNRDRPSYMMEPMLWDQLEGGIPRESLPKEAYSDENGVVRYRDTGQPVPIVKRPGLLPLVSTPEGVRAALPRLIDWLLFAGGGASGTLPAPKTIRVGSQAAGARAARPPVNEVFDHPVAEAQVAADRRVAHARPSAANDNTMPEQRYLHPPPSNDNIAPGQKYFDPPNVKRPFEADYPRATDFDLRTQKLLQDMDEVPILDSSTVIGRKTLGGPDVPLLEEDFHDFAKLLTDKRGGLKEVEPHEMKRPGSRAETDFDKDGIPTEFRVLRTLSPKDRAAAATREFANAIAAWIRPFREYDSFSPFSRMEMRRVYNELGNPKRIEGRPDKDARPFTPADRGYSADETPWEYLAEAVRGYLTEPGWLKSVAPRTAKDLRQIARDHVWLKKFLHFNALAPMMLGGAGAARVGASASRDARDPETDERNGG
jgi:hypothetical protein